MRTAIAILAAVMLCGCGEAKSRTLVASVNGLGLATTALAWVQTHPNEPQSQANHEPLGAPQVVQQLAKAAPPEATEPETVTDEPIEVPIQPEPEVFPPSPGHIDPSLMQSSGNVGPVDMREILRLYTTTWCPACPQAKRDIEKLTEYHTIYPAPPPWVHTVPTIHWQGRDGWWSMPWNGVEAFKAAHARHVFPQAAQSGPANHRRHKSNKPSQMCPMAADTSLNAKDVVNEIFDVVGTGTVKMNSFYSINIPANTKLEFVREKDTISVKVHGNAYPLLKLHAAGLGYSANITGAKITRDKVTVQIASFPDVTFSVESLDQ